MINLQIRETGVFTELEFDGIKQFRQIEPQRLVEILHEALYNKVEQEQVESPLLPNGTIKFIQEVANNDVYTLYMYKEARIAPIIFEGRDYIVGYPATIFAFEVRNKILLNTNVWAISDTVVKPDTQIYHYPFFNVYNNGRICMGSNKITIEEPWQLYKMPDVFTSMPSTLAMENRNLSGLEGDSMLQAIQNKPFPNEWLKPTENTLKTILKQL